MEEERHEAGGSRLRSGVLRLLDSPLVGLSPWIVYTLVSGPGRLELSCVLALGTALVFVVLGRLRGGSLKLLELSDVVFFGALAVVVAVASPGTYRWLETWSGEVANIALVLIAVGSMLARVPFTLQYARETVDRSLWDNPAFLRTNYVITGAWALAFLVEAASGAYGDAVLHDSNNLWTGWIIQTAALVVAAQFTVWYPQRVRARAPGSTEEPPPVAQFLVSLTGWLTVIGILVLVFDGGPTWLGVGLIVAGSALTHQLARRARPMGGEGLPA
jgi:hypothetical protein